MDCQSLQENAVEGPGVQDLLSPRYLLVFNFLFAGIRELPLWKTLYSMCKYDFQSTVFAVVDRFIQSPSNGLEFLTQYVDLFMDKGHSQSNMVANIYSHLKAVSNISGSLLIFQDRETSLGNFQASYRNLIPTEAFRFFRIIDAKLQLFVTKQVSSLSLELSKVLVAELSSILKNVVLADESHASAMLPKDYETAVRTNMDDLMHLTDHAWRMSLFRKCIVHGRMEIRVQGVETMQEDLVGVFTRHIQSKNDLEHPTVRYCSDFILSHKLVDYLVGVDSHPQLMQRSKNLVGFLVVANKYTEAESDVIWRTISSTKDSRTIDAILEMLTGILNIMSYPILLYLCQKLNELPLRYFDGKMISFSGTTLELLRKKWDRRLKLDMPPYHFCIRLLRQATADSLLTPNKKQELYHFAVSQLHQLMKSGPSEADSNTIYEECVKDISVRSAMATGSIAALNVFLDQSPEPEMHSLAATSDICGLTIGEFEHFTASLDMNIINSQYSIDSLDVRLSLIQKIITYLPNSVTTELGQKLWSCMLGDEALGDHARDAAWAMLTRIAHDCSGRNVFLEQCLTKYLALLDPTLFTTGVLHFAERILQGEQAISTEPRMTDSAKSDTEHAMLGVELLWHLSLMVPNPEIGSKAIGMLVKVYLDNFKSSAASDISVDKAHARLVERCIHQLISAASKLKRLNDGTSGEDDSMIIVASAGDVNIEKLHFARSLSILKEFMQEIRYRLPDSPLSTSSYRSPNSINGEKIRIRYQSYSGSSSTSIHTIEISEHATFGELATRLIKLTGFSKFIAIAGGQKLDQAALHNVALHEMRLQQGLLIIKKAADAEKIRDPTTMTSSRPLESEVMKHFHELYDLLTIDASLGREVS